jgi:hypothetical protein
MIEVLVILRLYMVEMTNNLKQVSQRRELFLQQLVHLESKLERVELNRGVHVNETHIYHLNNLNRHNSNVVNHSQHLHHQQQSQQHICSQPLSSSARPFHPMTAAHSSLSKPTRAAIIAPKASSSIDIGSLYVNRYISPTTAMGTFAYTYQQLYNMLQQQRQQMEQHQQFLHGGLMRVLKCAIDAQERELQRVKEAEKVRDNGNGMQK